MDKLTKEEGLLLLELISDSIKETKEVQKFNLYQNQHDQEYLNNKLKLLTDIYNKDFYSHK